MNTRRFIVAASGGLLLLAAACATRTGETTAAPGGATASSVDRSMPDSGQTCRTAAAAANQQFRSQGALTVAGNTCTWRDAGGQTVEVSVIPPSTAQTYYRTAESRSTGSLTIAGRPAVWAAPRQLVVLGTAQAFVIAVPGPATTSSERDAVATAIAHALIEGEA